MRSATTSLPGQPSSVPQARRWTVATLTSWGLDVTAWTAAQVVSELATNCTLHARSDFTVRLSVEDAGLRVQATDGAPGGLQARQYGSTATTGRGLRIVETLATAWGVVPATDGKTVWAVLPLEEAVPAPDERVDAQQPVSPAPGPAPAPAPAPAGPAPAGPSALAAA